MTLDPVRLVPCVINVDDTDSPADMIDALRSGRKDAADIYRAPEAVGQYL